VTCHGGAHETIRRILVAVLFAAMAVSLGESDRVSRAQIVDNVSVSVRVSPLQAKLVVAPERVRVGRVVVAISQISNVGHSRVFVLESRLGYQTGALRVLLHIGPRETAIRPHAHRTDVWVLLAQRPGQFVLVASAAAMTSDGVPIHVDSNGEMLDVRPR
jgi:hypothetical protein